jgi:hypothetical protein
VTSRNYSKIPDTNFSPKECTDYREEFNVSFFKLTDFSVLSMVWWWFRVRDDGKKMAGDLISPAGIRRS